MRHSDEEHNCSPHIRSVLEQAARAGLGMVIMPTYVADRDPALRRLARPDLRHVADLWLLSHPDLRENARFRATRACISEALRDHSDLFRGDWCTDAPLGPEFAPDDSSASSVR